MTEASQYRECQLCGLKDVPEFGETLRPGPCSRCDSDDTLVVLEVHETLGIVQDQRLTFDSSGPSRTQAKKTGVDYKFGLDWWHDGGKFVYRYQEVNRRDNRYVKFVLDRETGKVLRYCNEPLDEHRSRR